MKQKRIFADFKIFKTKIFCYNRKATKIQLKVVKIRDILTNIKSYKSEKNLLNIHLLYRSNKQIEEIHYNIKKITILSPQRLEKEIRE